MKYLVKAKVMSNYETVVDVDSNRECKSSLEWELYKKGYKDVEIKYLRTDLVPEVDLDYDLEFLDDI